MRMQRMHRSTHRHVFTGQTGTQLLCVRINSFVKPLIDTIAESKRRSRNRHQQRASIGTHVQSSASTKEAATQSNRIDAPTQTLSQNSNSGSSWRPSAESFADPDHANTAIDSLTASASEPQGSIPAVVALITGCSVGAGILALPAATTSAGFGPTAGV